MVLEVTILGNKTNQVIHSFGASDAWSTNQVGLWDSGKKEEIAKLLFDRSLDDEGRPRGIGLSCWRIMAGAGSARISKGPKTWRHTDTYLKPEWAQRGVGDDTSYDFNRNPGQRWFLHAARKYNVPHYVLFAHAPPYPLTVNGVTSSSTCSLKTHDGFRSREFAAYLCKIASHFERLGVVFSAISPVHEPHWNGADVDTESCPYTNEEVGLVAQSLEAEIRARRLPALVGVPEAGCIDYLIETIPGYERSSGFISAYFGDGELCPPKGLTLITGHSYFSCWSQEDRLIDSRERLSDAIRPSLKNGAQYWATEYSLYIPLSEPFVPKQVVRALSPGGRDEAVQDRTNIDSALWAARVIHADLAVANASAWHWWLALSPTDVPDGLIRYDNEEQTYTPTKTFYALGNYSLFVRPGMTRVDMHRSDHKVDREVLEETLFSAYMGEGTVVLIATNMSHIDQEVQVGLTNCGSLLPGATWFTSYLTSAGASLTPYQTFCVGGTVTIPKRSIVTSVAYTVSEGSEFFLLAASSEHGVPMCLEVAQASPAKCAVVGLGKLHGHAHQAWRFFGVSGGLLGLAACHSGHALEVVNGSTMPKAPLHQNGVRSFEAQNWTLGKLSNGCAYLSVKHVGHVLEAYGSAVRVSQRSGRPEQLWFLVPRDSNLKNLPSNPALAAARSAQTTKTAWAGEWVDELPPPMATVKQIMKPKGRYDTPQQVETMTTVQKTNSGRSSPEMRGEVTTSQADELRKELQRQNEQILQQKQLLQIHQQQLKRRTSRSSSRSNCCRYTNSS
eukprot:TRINITY_DN580_c1_g1_i2.p1 TRINITY_DN580_c1_g1~~TRINITY_DN580_c1_g1_i2.p1  ORF type:complete len:819 (+),score=156.60 TRINITY_DN580_c1_g1_i2:100-2457(+)